MAEVVEAVVEPVYPAAESEQRCLEWSRVAVRGIERFAYRRLSSAALPAAVVDAEHLLRTVIGLRRKLDRWKLDETGGEAHGDV